MKARFLLSLLMLLVVSASAQKAANSLVVKFSDGTQYNMSLAGALFQKDSSLAIVGSIKGNISHSFQMQIIPTKDKSREHFKKGYYYFNYMDQMMDFVPGQTFSYKLQGFYLQEKGGTTEQEWMTETNPEEGFIEIEFISATRIKGRFSFELVQRFPTKGAKNPVVGSFDVEIIQSNP